MILMCLLIARPKTMWRRVRGLGFGHGKEAGYIVLNKQNDGNDAFLT